MNAGDTIFVPIVGSPPLWVCPHCKCQYPRTPHLNVFRCEDEVGCGAVYEYKGDGWCINRSLDSERWGRSESLGCTILHSPTPPSNISEAVIAAALEGLWGVSQEEQQNIALGAPQTDDQSLTRDDLERLHNATPVRMLNTQYGHQGWEFEPVWENDRHLDYVLCRGPVEGRDQLLKDTYLLQCGEGWKIRTRINSRETRVGWGSTATVACRPLPDRKYFLIRFEDGVGPVDAQPTTVPSWRLPNYPQTDDPVEVDENGIPVADTASREDAVHWEEVQGNVSPDMPTASLPEGWGSRTVFDRVTENPD